MPGPTSQLVCKGRIANAEPHALDQMIDGTEGDHFSTSDVVIDPELPGWNLASPAKLCALRAAWSATRMN